MHGQVDRYRQIGDLISLLLFVFQNKESKLKMFLYFCTFRMMISSLPSPRVPSTGLGACRLVGTGHPGPLSLNSARSRKIVSRTSNEATDNPFLQNVVLTSVHAICASLEGFTKCKPTLVHIGVWGSTVATSRRMEFWEIITSLAVSNQKGNYNLARSLEPEGKLKSRSLSRTRKKVMTSALSRTRREIVTSLCLEPEGKFNVAPVSNQKRNCNLVLCLEPEGKL
jgi:hypothetical protein